MEFAQIIEELGQKAGISDLKLDERGSCSLLFRAETPNEPDRTEVSCMKKNRKFWIALILRSEDRRSGLRAVRAA